MKAMAQEAGKTGNPLRLASALSKAWGRSCSMLFDNATLLEVGRVQPGERGAVEQCGQPCWSASLRTPTAERE
jgi:hypothetical protein